MDLSLRVSRVSSLLLIAMCVAAAATPAQWSGGSGSLLYTYDDVSIGSSWGGYPLTVVAADTQRVVYGLNLGVGGTRYGVVGRINAGDSGAGVFGQTTSSTAAAGVHGSSVGFRGAGVRGVQTSTSGSGVEGTTDSGSGVLGVSHQDGYGKGVRGVATGSPVPSGLFGNVYPYGVLSQGNLGVTGSKAFLQPHPTDASKVVQFICLEGNEAGTYFRGKARLVGGLAEIPIPDEWRLVTDDDGITVQLTKHGPGDVWVASTAREKIVVAGAPDLEFNYLVQGVRRGFTDYQPYRPNDSFRPEVRGVPFGMQYSEELRQILVQNGTLYADYTPNEATANRLGWKLRNPEDVPPAARYWLSAEQRRALAGGVDDPPSSAWPPSR